MVLVFAQSGSREDVIKVLILLAILIGVVLVAGVVLLVVRQRIIKSEQHLNGSMFDDLKRLRDKGQISQAEYDYLRKSLAAKVAGREPPPRPANLEFGEDELRARPGFDLTGEPLPPEVLRAQSKRNEEQ